MTMSLSSAVARTPAPPPRRPPAAGLAALRGHSTTLRAGERLPDGADSERGLLVVRSGWLRRSRLLPDGRSQILELILPGEHLPARRPRSADADCVGALNRCEVVSVQSLEAQEARARSAELDAVLEAAERRRVAILNERIVSLGQRRAVERTAHLFCELVVRLGGDTPVASCELPMTQADLSEFLGLSVVHTNRMIQALRHMSLAEVGRGRLRVLDFEGLAEAGGFTPDYLA